ncbi:hypothetical protein FOS14_01135 [Skermania sp. ID1734]|uniref:hypothetical protein n=1 Tax=Skermania sp. ID1734 TaxID=2597516 RepID=UPI00117FB05B|nr:hypothetical protein [Skermania sp. ID1734]TSE02021.1 hypothetical protein FOS14_01135 [Skermania sp. ID1734]
MAEEPDERLFSAPVSWGDDGPTGPRRTGRKRTWIPVVAALIAVVAAAAGVGVVVWRSSPADPVAAPITSAVSTPTTSAVVLQPDCPVANGNVVRGNGIGGTETGPGAILGFQHAYYVARNGELARTFVAPEANVQAAEQIQAGIDSLARDTKHCVSIIPAGVDTYSVEVTEDHRDGSSTLYKQKVTTTVRDGRNLIAHIAVE